METLDREAVAYKSKSDRFGRHRGE
jgi:hypothetical protein